MNKSTLSNFSTLQHAHRSLANLTQPSLSPAPSPLAAANQFQSGIGGFLYNQDDVALKKRLTRDDLRKREFDRKLERDLQSIDQIINFKQKPHNQSTATLIMKQ